jgi:hypothetical protein
LAGVGLAAAAAAGAVALGGAAFADGGDAGARPAQLIVDDGGLVWPSEYGSAGRTADGGAAATTGERRDCPEKGGSGSTTPDGESGSEAPESGGTAPDPGSQAPQAPATTPAETL